MGLTVHEIKFLLWARQGGVDFSSVMMLGRQKLHLDPCAMRAALADFGISQKQAEVDALFLEQNGYAESFFKLLGAQEICSTDASAYEQATHVFDMNKAAGDDLKGKFSAVLDGGSLEHIFQFPTAIRNCMEMVKVNGHFISFCPCNNYLGHGFYQFSPELFFRILSAENGFKMEKMILFESPTMARWYEVKDPEELGKRVELRTWGHARLAIQARRVALKTIFETTPQQSDYSAAWQSTAGACGMSGGGQEFRLSASGRFGRRLLRPLKKFVWGLLESAKQRQNGQALREIRVPESK
jgi:hypothetical protein